jgi:hypothetical protein
MRVAFITLGFSSASPRGSGADLPSLCMLRAMLLQSIDAHGARVKFRVRVWVSVGVTTRVWVMMSV